MKTKKNIQFGILVNLGITNDHYLNESDPLSKEWFVKLDTYNYLHPFSEDTTFEDFEKECDNFKGWADQITATDGNFGYGTDFFFVCYITDRDNKPSEVRKIKQLYY